MGLVALIIGYFVRKYIAEAKINSAEEEAKKIREEAEKDAEATKRESILEAKEEVHRLRSEFEKEIKERRSELQRAERRLLQKEETLDKKTEAIEKKENYLEQKEKQIESLQAEIQTLYEKQLAELERLSGLTSEEAKEILLSNIRDQIKHESALLIKEIETQAREEAEKRAKEIIVTSIQKCAADYVAETTVSVISLPNDEMKGRIIGREGRNIRALETLTGVDFNR